jgi:hypothetical protein
MTTQDQLPATQDAREPAPAEPAGPRRRPRLPVAVLAPVVLLLVALVARPQQVRTTLASPRVWALAVAVVAVTLLLRRATRAVPRLPRRAADVVVAVPAVVAVLVLVVPTLRSTTVSEELEGLAPASGTAASDGGAADGAPVRVATAEVEGIGHRASGSASLVELADGTLVVRFEDLDVDPGPDYRVILVPGAGAEEPGDGVELGRLKATSGDQNYELPDGTEVERPFTALIWCEAFSVPIAGASIT